MRFFFLFLHRRKFAVLKNVILLFCLQPFVSANVFRLNFKNQLDTKGEEIVLMNISQNLVMALKKFMMLTETVHLLQALKKNDRSAQKYLYESYAKAMYNVALRITGDADDAQDALQESFIKIFKSIGRFDYPEKMPAWIKKITVNTSLNLLKSRKRKLKLFDELPSESYESTDFDIADENLLRVEAVKKAVKQLPDGFRVIFTLHVFEGYDHTEISEILGISESTSKTQLLRARQKLCAMLKNKL